MLSRENLLKTPEYWFEGEQNELYRQVLNYLEKENITKSELAKRLNVSKGRISQILDGEYNYSLKKLIDICLTIGLVQQIKYSTINEILKEDAEKKNLIEFDPLEFKEYKNIIQNKEDANMRLVYRNYDNEQTAEFNVAM